MNTTPGDWARALREEAQRCRAEGDKWLAAAGAHDLAAETLEALGGVAPAASKARRSPLPSHALKIADGRARDALSRACVERGMTLGQMVGKVRVELGLRLPVSGVSQARSGTRPVRREVAEAIERLAGFAATAANWRGGIR